MTHTPRESFIFAKQGMQELAIHIGFDLFGRIMSLMTYFPGRHGGAYISLDEAQKRTELSRQQLLEAIDQGVIRTAEIGSSVFVDVTTLDRRPMQGERSASARARSRHTQTRVRRSRGGSERDVSMRSAATENSSHAGPERFVFRWRDTQSALAVLVLAGCALVLSAPVYERDESPSNVADAFFGENTETRYTHSVMVDLPPRDDERRTQNIATAHAGGAEDIDVSAYGDRPLAANALAAAAEALQGAARFIHSLFGFEQ